MHSQREQKQIGRPIIRTLPHGMLWKIWTALLFDMEKIASKALIEEITKLVRARDLKSVKGVGDTWGLQSIASKSLNNSLEIAANQLLSRGFSKYTTDANAQVLHHAALEKFESVDREVDSSMLRGPILNRLKSVIGAIIGPFPGWAEVFPYCNHGPGSTWSHPYSARAALYKWAKLPYDMHPRTRTVFLSNLTEWPMWSQAIVAQYSDFACGAGATPWQPAEMLEYVTNEVRANRITSVPKDCSKRRTIAKEPVYNMFLQLGLHSLLAERLERKTGISIRSTTRAKQLAIRGSLDESWLSPATIDLSEASDRLSHDLVMAVFPSQWALALDTIRSEFSELQTKSIQLKKYATMGNGTTFIIQTIVYYAMSYLAQTDKDRFYPELTYVFGDDISLPRIAWPRLRTLLEGAGLKVNVDKSFVAGPVRESCGVDIYRGDNIRPVFYRKDYDGDLDGFLAYRNQLWLWSQENHIDLPSTLELLDKHVSGVPSVPATLALSSGLFYRYLSPLEDGREWRVVKWASKPDLIQDDDVPGPIWDLARLCAPYTNSVPSGTVYQKGSRQARPKRASTVLRYGTVDRMHVSDSPPVRARG